MLIKNALEIGHKSLIRSTSVLPGSKRPFVFLVASWFNPLMSTAANLHQTVSITESDETAYVFPQCQVRYAPGQDTGNNFVASIKPSPELEGKSVLLPFHCCWYWNLGMMQICIYFMCCRQSDNLYLTSAWKQKQIINFWIYLDINSGIKGLISVTYSIRCFSVLHLVTSTGENVDCKQPYPLCLIPPFSGS